MGEADVKTAYETLRRRVLAVAALARRCALLAGAGRLGWRLGLPLLLVVLLHAAWGLPFYLRAPVLPLLAAGLLWWGWRDLVRPWRKHYGLTRAALLVEAARPQLVSRVVSALELYPELAAPAPRSSPELISALVRYAQDSTRDEDFRAVVDRRPARRQLAGAAVALVLWLAATGCWPAGVADGLRSLVTAWAEVREVTQQVAGAEITVEPLDQAAYLVGSDVRLRARQRGFHHPELRLLLRAQGANHWTAQSVPVSADGTGETVLRNVQASFECYFTAGRIQSRSLTVPVTERPRLVSLSVEYELPAYVRRAAIVQPRSDGNLRCLYGTTLVLTVEANKDLKTAQLSGSFLPAASTLAVAGRYARGILRLEGERWLRPGQAEVRGTWQLALTDEFGFTNADAAHAYELVVTRDQPPQVTLVGLPHRSPADEPHVLAQNLGNLSAVIRASDDWGIAKVTLHYRLEDLETGARQREDRKEWQFPLPRADIPQLALLRFNDVGAQVGDRIVFSVEVEDAYDLEPSGPHRVATPVYRLAVVTQEELFAEAVYRDDWSTQWYEALQVATLTRREIPPRSSPTSEGAAQVARKLLEASWVSDGLSGADQQLVQDYFDSLNVGRPGGQ